VSPTHITCDPSVVLESFESMDATRLLSTTTSFAFGAFLTRLGSVILFQNGDNSTVINFPQPNIANENHDDDDDDNEEDDHDEENDGDDDEEPIQNETYAPSSILENVIGGADICTFFSCPHSLVHQRVSRSKMLRAWWARLVE
jgi:hypothetical protein